MSLKREKPLNIRGIVVMFCLMAALFINAAPLARAEAAPAGDVGAVSARDTFLVEGALTRGKGLQMDISVKPLTEYSGDAYVVIQLMDGKTPLLINAIPIKETGNEIEISQYFNVSGADYKVKVFIFNSFDSELDVPVQLARPIELR